MKIAILCFVCSLPFCFAEEEAVKPPHPPADAPIEQANPPKKAAAKDEEPTFDRKELLRQGETERKAKIKEWTAYVGAHSLKENHQRKILEYQKMKGKFLPTLELASDSIGVFRDLDPAAKHKAQKNDGLKANGERPQGRAAIVSPFISIEGLQDHVWAGKEASVLQVIDGENILVNWLGNSIWITKYSTAGLVDDKTLEPKGVFKYLGTKTYQTAIGGSRTVHLIEKIGESRIQ